MDRALGPLGRKSGTIVVLKSKLQKIVFIKKCASKL